MKKIILFLVLCLFLVGCSEVEEPVVFNYNFLIGTWTEYKPQDIRYIDTNQPYPWDSPLRIDTIAFTPSYEKLEYYKYNGKWIVGPDIVIIYPVGDIFTEGNNYYYDYNKIIQDGKNIIIESKETDYNRKFIRYFKKISKEWKLEYMLNDINNKKNF
jgi:hypothetical protein